MIYTKSCTTIEADDKCAVCLSEYIGGETLKRLRCKHFFHGECIDPWLKVRPVDQFVRDDLLLL